MGTKGSRQYGQRRAQKVLDSTGRGGTKSFKTIQVEVSTKSFKTIQVEGGTKSFKTIHTSEGGQ